MVATTALQSRTDRSIVFIRRRRCTPTSWFSRRANLPQTACRSVLRFCTSHFAATRASFSRICQVAPMCASQSNAWFCWPMHRVCPLSGISVCSAVLVQFTELFKILYFTMPFCGLDTPNCSFPGAIYTPSNSFVAVASPGPYASLHLA